MIPSDPILIFDGVCNLCNGLVRFIIKRDKGAKIKFASLQSPAGQSLLVKFELAADEVDSVVYITGEKHFLKSSAVLHLLKDLGCGWGLLYVFIILPEFFRDLIYNQVARSRYRIFGKRDACMIPPPDAEKRFIQ